MSFSAAFLRRGAFGFLLTSCYLVSACSSPTATPLAPYPIEYCKRDKRSFAMGLVEFAIRHVYKSPEKTLKEFTSGAIFKRSDVVASLPKVDTAVVALSLNNVLGRQVFTFRPKHAAATSGKVVLYIHGGAYIYGFSDGHWAWLQYLAQQTGYTVVSPDYPLAPQHKYQEAFAQVEAVYQDLVAKVGAQNIVLMGESAGAGLALAVAEKVKKEGKPVPGQLVLLSPWLDAAMENPAIKPLEPLDPMLTVTNLQLAAKAYAGATPLSDYQLSPINGDLAGLPRTSVFIGTSDLFLADVRKFKQLMARQGNPINYFEYNGAIHGWMVIGKTPEAQTARQQIADLLKQ